MMDTNPETKLMEIKEIVGKFIGDIKNFEIESKEDEQKAASLLSQVKVRKDRVKYWQDYFVKPLKVQTRKMDLTFKAQLDPLIQIEKDIKEQMRVYALKQEQEAKEKVQKMKESKGDIPIKPILAPETKVVTEHGMIMKRKKWSWKVTDKDKLQKARPDLFVVDEKLINQMVRNGERHLEGVEIFEDVVIVNR